MDIKDLYHRASEARKYAYTPYSHFSVGAALLCADGSIYTGVNIESATFTPTNCAERTAFFKAISEGKHNFVAIAVAGNKDTSTKENEICPPCGVCRQVMAEFCDINEFIIILSKDGETFEKYKLCELLPLTFDKSKLK